MLSTGCKQTKFTIEYITYKKYHVLPMKCSASGWGGAEGKGLTAALERASAAGNSNLGQRLEQQRQCCAMAARVRASVYSCNSKGKVGARQQQCVAAVRQNSGQMAAGQNSGWKAVVRHQWQRWLWQCQRWQH